MNIMGEKNKPNELLKYTKNRLQKIRISKK